MPPPVPGLPGRPTSPPVTNGNGTLSAPNRPPSTPPPPTLTKPVANILPPNGARQVEVLAGKKVTFVMHKLSNDTVKIVNVLIAKAIDPEGAILRVADPLGNTLVDAALGIPVDVEKFSAGMREHTLSDGSYHIN